VTNGSASPTPTPSPAMRPRATGAGRDRSHRRQARTWLLMAGILGLLLAGAAYWAALSDDSPAATPPPVSDASPGNLAAVSGHGAAIAPPWPAPADVPARAKAAGLPLGPMGMAEHYHAHLDVLIDGQPVPVPANIGVDSFSGAMSYLHTHTADGLMHIEAGTKGQAFTLGQLFTQWDVRLTPTQVGGLTATDGNALTLYVNGKKMLGDPAQLRLATHQQIALVYGPAGQGVDVPARYDFAAGE
jgi:hypothetical protein